MLQLLRPVPRAPGARAPTAGEAIAVGGLRAAVEGPPLARRGWREPACSGEDPTQPPKIIN